jgi:hypothetical protein
MTEPASSSTPTFLSLPLEIRQNIYRHLLVQPDFLIPWRGQRSYGNFDLDEEERWGRETGSLDLSILLVSRAVYSESVPILYGENVFGMDVRDTQTEWIGSNGLDSAVGRHLGLMRYFWASISYVPSAGNEEKYIRAYVQSSTQAIQEIEMLCPGVTGVKVELRDNSEPNSESYDDGEVDENVTGPDESELYWDVIFGPLPMKQTFDGWSNVEKVGYDKRDLIRPWLEVGWKKVEVEGDVPKKAAKKMEEEAVAAYGRRLKSEKDSVRGDETIEARSRT